MVLGNKEEWLEQENALKPWRLDDEDDDVDDDSGGGGDNSGYLSAGGRMEFLTHIIS